MTIQPPRKPAQEVLSWLADELSIRYRTTYLPNDIKDFWLTARGMAILVYASPSVLLLEDAVALNIWHAWQSRIP